MSSSDERLIDAAEHAIGLTEHDDPPLADSMLANDPDFLHAAALWQERFRELDATAVPAPANEALWQRIASSLAASPETVAPGVREALAPLGQRNEGFLGTVWQNLSFWRTVGLCGSAAAFVLALLIPGPFSTAPAGPLYVAVLMTDANQPAGIVNTYRDGRVELISLDPVAVPEGRSLQVWTLWDRARGPVSIGLLDRARSVSLEVGGLPPTITDQLFEITLEPKQGSPTGRPTGPILMKGLTHTAL
jgi:anti-sigma-K factor RskA